MSASSRASTEGELLTRETVASQARPLAVRWHCGMPKRVSGQVLTPTAHVGGDERPTRHLLQPREASPVGTMARRVHTGERGPVAMATRSLQREGDLVSSRPRTCARLVPTID